MSLARFHRELFSAEEELRRRLAKKVRRITPYRRALEFQAKARARAKAEGRSVRWDDAVAELARTDPKAAEALQRIAERQRAYTRRRYREHPPAELSPEEQARRRARELAWHKRQVRERWKTPLRCELCGVEWCLIPAPGRRRSRFCSDRCRWRAADEEKRRRKRVAPGGARMGEIERSGVQAREIARGRNPKMTADVRTPGRPVTRGEVAACADSKCKACFGRGRFTKWVAGERVERLCGCAIRRFDRQHPEVIRDKDSGMHFWPAGEDDKPSERHND